MGKGPHPPPPLRFAVLTLALPEGTHGYVVFDRQTARIVDGVYPGLPLAVMAAALCEVHSGAREGIPISAEALGLRFPPPPEYP